MPFIYYFLILPLTGSVISYQLKSQELVVLNDTNHTIVPKSAAGTQKILDPYELFKTEQENLYKAFMGKRVVPVVPWVLFIAFGMILPFPLTKKFGGKYYEDNQVLRSFLILLGMGIGFCAVQYWHAFAIPPKPLTVWPQDYANYFDYLQQRAEIFWPIIAAWVIPLSVALLKLIGLDGLGQIFEKLGAGKK